MNKVDCPTQTIPISKGRLYKCLQKAYYNINEIGAGKPGFSKTRSIIEAAFYGNNVVKINTLKEAYELAKNSPGTIVTDMPVYRGEKFGLEKKTLKFCFSTTVPSPDVMPLPAVSPENLG